MRNEDKYRKLRAEAKILLLVEGLTKKETAKKLGVMPKTIGKWCSDYGWNAALKDRLKINPSANSLYDFIQHVKTTFSEDFLRIETLYRDYLNRF